MRGRFLASVASIAALASIFVTAIPSAARADDVGTDAAIGAAVGSIVSSLIFDQNRQQYYYYDNGRAEYVSRGYARNWYEHRDAGFWRNHRNEFYNDGSRFAGDFRENHPQYARGENRGDRGGWNLGDDRRAGGEDHGNWNRGDDRGNRNRGDDWHRDGRGRDQ